MKKEKKGEKKNVRGKERKMALIPGVSNIRTVFQDSSLMNASWLNL